MERVIGLLTIIMSLLASAATATIRANDWFPMNGTLVVRSKVI